MFLLDRLRIEKVGSENIPFIVDKIYPHYNTYILKSILSISEC